MANSTLCSGFETSAGDYDCGYKSQLFCDECKFGGAGGRKDPRAKCNQKEKSCG